MTDTLVEELCGDLSAVRAPRGPTLNARSWQTEAPLRMFGTVLLLSPNLPIAQKVTQTVLIVAIFIPFSYFLDRFFYRSAQRRNARRDPSDGRRGS